MPALAWEDFAESQGTVYTVAAGEDRYELTLESATELASSGRPEGAFSLLFRGPFEPILGQGIHSFSAGDFAGDIFIVPIGRDERGALYEAVFF